MLLALPNCCSRMLELHTKQLCSVVVYKSNSILGTCFEIVVLTRVRFAERAGAELCIKFV